MILSFCLLEINRSCIGAKASDGLKDFWRDEAASIERNVSYDLQQQNPLSRRRPLPINTAAKNGSKEKFDPCWFMRELQGTHNIHRLSPPIHPPFDPSFDPFFHPSFHPSFHLPFHPSFRIEVNSFLGSFIRMPFTCPVIQTTCKLPQPIPSSTSFHLN